MLISTDININIEPGIPSGEKEIIIFLHGFSGSTREWENVLPIISSSYDCVAVDLIGHGLSESPDSPLYYSSSSIVSQLHNLISQLPTKKIILAGYSMGGRAALSLAVRYPWTIKALILESTSPGIINENDRAARKRNDELLADFINEKGIEEFVNYWINIDLFKNQKKLSEDKLQKQIKEKLKNNKIGLVNSLMGFGTGVMPHLYDELNKLNFPILLLTGEFDIKFTKINFNIKSSFRNASYVIIKDAGHNIHFEQPEIFASEVNLFLTSLK
ncbi:MAG: 2-succinyl-6-hydroxy-2,4-cyclohexadiene-1-carboxylate synthase [Ignavibacteria bacterium CG_4_9_14_3_um_filter_36_18]|nr:2-succinyl-6-hydroxy-2,4-cyclohexadiene-1-carboxylate synthase [Ignavibacteria bacterium]PJA99778.1 MAG: 2-succinyl-6-hydroxy-2,4-cyclohexadiene-1-carboxylate synthase [Ignavibacteria bacterium CG_4_9_14_3_um_filter_36_18]